MKLIFRETPGWCRDFFPEFFVFHSKIMCSRPDTVFPVSYIRAEAVFFTELIRRKIKTLIQKKIYISKLIRLSKLANVLIWN